MAGLWAISNSSRTRKVIERQTQVARDFWIKSSDEELNNIARYGYGFAKYWHMSEVQFVAREIPAGRLLDLGCGSGRMLSVLTAMGRRCIGADYVFDNCRLAAQRTGMPVVCADMRHLPFRTNTLDGIVASRAIQSLLVVEEKERTIRQIARLLSASGRLILLEGHPSPFATEPYFNKFLSIDEWRLTLSQAGLKMTRARGIFFLAMWDALVAQLLGRKDLPSVKEKNRVPRQESSQIPIRLTFKQKMLNLYYGLAYVLDQSTGGQVAVRLSSTNFYLVENSTPPQA